MEEGEEVEKSGKSGRPKVGKKSEVGSPKPEEGNNSAIEHPKFEIKNKSEIVNRKSEMEVHHHPEVEKKRL